jgi:hypothetical protein
MNPINIDNIPYSVKEYFGGYDNIKTVIDLINASLVQIDPSGNVALSLSYIDTSFGARDVSIAALNSIKATIAYVNSSIGARDTSIAYVNAGVAAADVSVAWLNTFKATTLTQLPTEDASGVNGQMFFASNKAYLKVGGKWIRFDASTIY